MARTRNTPVAAIIVAIMNLVIYVPCLCCSGAGAVIGSAVGDGTALVSDPKLKEQVKKQQQELEAEIPNAKAIGIVKNVIMLLLSVVMVVAAIGLLMKQSWGRLACLIGAALIILVVLVDTVYQATSVLPVTLRLQEQQLQKQPGAAPLGKGFFQGVGYGALVVQVVIMAGYPLLAIAIMMIAPVRRFYSGAGGRGADAELDDLDRREDDEDDRRRRDDDDRRYDDDR